MFRHAVISFNVNTSQVWLVQYLIDCLYFHIEPISNLVKMKVNICTTNKNNHISLWIDFHLVGGQKENITVDSSLHQGTQCGAAGAQLVHLSRLKKLAPMVFGVPDFWESTRESIVNVEKIVELVCLLRVFPKVDLVEFVFKIPQEQVAFQPCLIGRGGSEIPELQVKNY